MRIYVLDDEPIALRGSVKIIQETAPQAQIRGFGRAKAAFKHIKESGEYPDVVFSDIEMPGMSGLDFAVRLKKQCPDTILIFVTAYSQYALEAFRLHVHGYILKPLTEARVREELDYALIRIGKRRSAKLPQGQDQTRGAGADAGAASDMGNQSSVGYKSGESSGSKKSRESGENDNADEMQDVKANDRRNANREDKLQVQCFGKFEVYWKGMPLMFSRAQTMELFAYLIDRKGAECTEEEIAGVLWPEEADKEEADKEEANMEELRSRVRILTGDLRRIFGSIGREDLIIRKDGRIAVRREAIDCDYYRMLAGDMDAVNDFQGEYMTQYSWAEIDV